MMRSVRIFLCGLLIFLVGCAGSAKKVAPPEQTGKPDAMDESFDPLTVKSSELEFEKKKDLVLPETPGEVAEQPVEKTVVNKKMDGYRIQLLSTKNLESATRAKHIAMEQFRDLMARFYLEFDSPYYKVRMGDFKNRDEAQKVREIVRSKGYPKAWTVPSKIWSNPELMDSTDSLNQDTTFPEN